MKEGGEGKLIRFQKLQLTSKKHEKIKMVYYHYGGPIIEDNISLTITVDYRRIKNK
jgi:hypothetical protein